MKITSLTLAALASSAYAATESCPSGIELIKCSEPRVPGSGACQWKWKWKEDHNRRKLASLKLLRERYGERLQRELDNGLLQELPDYDGQGWTIVIEFDRPVPQGIFQAHHGRYLSSNADGSAIAFASNADNRHSLNVRDNVLRPWFEIAFTFDDDEATFEFSKVTILEGEYANVQCLFDQGYNDAAIPQIAAKNNDFDPFANPTGESASMMALASQITTLVNHQDGSYVIAPTYNGIKPFEMGGHYMDKIYNQGPKCENGVANWKGRCYDVVDTCQDCNDGFSKEQDLCLADGTTCDCAESKVGIPADWANTYTECGTDENCSNCQDVYYVEGACPVDVETPGHAWPVGCEHFDDSILTTCDVMKQYPVTVKEAEFEYDEWSFNRIHSNAFSNHPSIEYILLRENIMQYPLPNDMFANNAALDFVDMREMNITHVSTDLFKNTNIITKIYLHNNAISSIDSEAFNAEDNPDLSILKLEGNPIWTSKDDNNLPADQMASLLDERSIELY